MRARSLVALSLAAAGCGEDARRAPAPEPVRRPPLPAGWSRAVAPVGFSLGVPPRWRVERSGGRLTLRSPDRALAVLAGIDGGDDARTQPLRSYAERLLAGLRGFRPPLRGRARRLRRTRFPEAVTVSAVGRRRDGSRQSVQLIALRPPRQGVSVLVLFRAASAPAARYRGVARRIVRTYAVEPPRP